jgi:hypothetical protein
MPDGLTPLTVPVCTLLSWDGDNPEEANMIPGAIAEPAKFGDSAASLEGLIRSDVSQEARVAVSTKERRASLEFGRRQEAFPEEIIEVRRLVQMFRYVSRAADDARWGESFVM